MEKRSLIAYENYREANQRFEYFLTGLIGALCAYIASTFIPVRIEINSGTIELAAILTLAVSFYFSIKRLQGIIMISRIVSRRLHILEKKGMLVVNSDANFLVNEDTGDILYSYDILNEINNIDKSLPGLEKTSAILNRKVNKYYKLRFFFLYTGFILLVVSKIWSAYY